MQAAFRERARVGGDVDVWWQAQAVFCERARTFDDDNGSICRHHLASELAIVAKTLAAFAGSLSAASSRSWKPCWIKFDRLDVRLGIYIKRSGSEDHDQAFS